MPEPARAFWSVAPGRGELRVLSLDAPGEGEALVRTLASGVSRGTEALVLLGRVPEGEHARMRCPMQEGAFPFPVKYGYAAVGVVEAGPAELRGRRVFCLHPHQDRFVAPAAALVPVPDNVPTRRAVLAANMETAVNVLWDAPVRLGQRVAVIGAGAVGCLVARLAAATPGAAVTLVDRRSDRARLAGALGLAFAAPEGCPADCDLVVEASGNPAALATALAAAGEEASVVVASWYGVSAAPAPLGGAFHSRRLRLVSSQVGRVAPAQRPRWSHRRRLGLALDLLADAALDALVADGVAFADLPAAMAAWAARPDDFQGVCPVVSYG